MHDNLKKAIDEFGDVDAQIKLLEKRKKALREQLIEALVQDTSAPVLVSTDRYTFEAKQMPGYSKISKELLIEDDIDPAPYTVQGSPYLRVAVKATGQKV